jgi:hypothetical protein
VHHAVASTSPRQARGPSAEGSRGQATLVTTRWRRLFDALIGNDRRGSTRRRPLIHRTAAFAALSPARAMRVRLSSESETSNLGSSDAAGRTSASRRVSWDRRNWVYGLCSGASGNHRRRRNDRRRHAAPRTRPSLHADGQCLLGVSSHSLRGSGRPPTASSRTCGRLATRSSARPSSSAAFVCAMPSLRLGPSLSVGERESSHARHAAMSVASRRSWRARSRACARCRPARSAC